MSSSNHWDNRIVAYGDADPATLVANPLNWRTHPARQKKAMIGALNQIGWIDEVKINRTTGRMIDGHLRVLVAVEKREATVPVKYVELSEEEEQFALATFDPLGALAEADSRLLGELLTQVEVDDPAISEMLEKLAHDSGMEMEGKPLVDAEPRVDRAAELRAEWSVESGQLWQLGDHLLICGDATDAEVVKRLMGDERAILFATDPPYLVDYDGKNHPHKWGDEDKNKDWSESYQDWDRAVEGDGLYDGFVAVAVAHAISPNAAWYCWHASRRQALLESVWEQHGAFVHQQIIWVKDRPVLTRSWYMWQHEPCFFGWVRGQKPPRHAEDHPRSVWQIPTIAPGQETLHPTSKPLELFLIPMRQHTQPGDVCYEPFSGSGSQLIAAENLGRKCRAVEKAPEYVAVALQRWHDATGKTPELIGGSDD